MRRSRGSRFLTALVAAKARHGHTVSVCLPAREEKATVGRVVATVRRSLVEHLHLVDEIVVMDDSSSDATGDAARTEGARVFPVAELMPELPPGSLDAYLNGALRRCDTHHRSSSARRPASTAASSTSRAARANASPACQ